MKFGKYLEEKQRPEWADKYLDYKALKDLIKQAAKQQEELGPQGYSPRITSLTVQRAMDSRDNAEERFFQQLEAEVDKVGNFTGTIVDNLREELFQLQAKSEEASTNEEKQALFEEAQRIGDEFLQLEKYVNLNYMGFHKILKKHDKNLPHSPCRQFYISHLHNQPWVQGNYSDLLLALSGVYALLTGKAAASDGAPAEEVGQRYSTTKYWVRMADVSAVKHHILQHLPVMQYDENAYTGDSKLSNIVYLDNSSLEVYHGRLDQRPNAIVVRIGWEGSQEPTKVHVELKTHSNTPNKGEDQLKQSFPLPESAVLELLEGELTAGPLQDFWLQNGVKPELLKEKEELLQEVQKVIDAKQLKPTVRTQYMRTTFQIPFDSTVVIKLDTNISMLKENPEDGPSVTLSGRWYRDPSLPIHRTEVTRFPHAVLELDLELESGQTTPEWVQELVDSGLLMEIERFSKHIHGIATLFPDMIQALPYWVDDDSVRASMLSSAPEQPMDLAPTARDQLALNQPKPRKGQLTEEEAESQPLLRRESTREVDERRRERRRRLPKTQSLLDWWFSKPPMAARPRIPGVVPKKSEAKTFLASERTFLAWLHMALTMGSIAAAMLGFSTGSSHDKTSGEVSLIAMVLLPVALMICGYALLVYHWRLQAIRNNKEVYYDDRRGPLALTIVVVSALAAIFLISLADLVSALRHPDEGFLLVWHPATLIDRLLS